MVDERLTLADSAGMTRPAVATVAEPPRQTPLLGTWEIVVLGGGPAGIAAAATAARLGRRTLLVERYGFLGGMGTAAGVTNFCGLHANVHGEIRRVVHGIADDLLGRIDRLGGLRPPHMIFAKTMAQAYDTAAYKLAADDLLTSAGAGLLFHAYAAGVLQQGRQVTHLLVETKSGRRAIAADLFIDASGDGDLAACAGAGFDLGDPHGDLLYPSTMFRVNNVEPVAAEAAIRDIDRLMAAAAAASGVPFPRRGVIVRPQKVPIEWRANVTQVATPSGRAVNATDALEFSAGEILGRRQVAQFFAFLQAHVPGFAQAYIVDLPPQLGVRETRRVRGHHQLTAADVIGCASFADSIGVNGWPLEQHVAGDVVWTWPDIPRSRGYNHLPWRMLVPVDLDNVLVAGRCASMDHGAHSAARVSGPCFVMGQAAATGAHLALAARRPPIGVEVAALQARLERDGVFLGR
jgi:hypothetical protein